MRCEFVIRLLIEPVKIELCLGSALWAEVAAQALKGCRAVLALSTIDCASGRARAVFFRSCLVPPIVPDPFGIIYSDPLRDEKQNRERNKGPVAIDPFRIGSRAEGITFTLIYQESSIMQTGIDLFFRLT
jgi:hypothetical protein